MISGVLTRGPAGAWALRSDQGALHVIQSGDFLRVLNHDGIAIYAGHVGLDGLDPLDIPVQLWSRWFDTGYRGEFRPR